MLKAFLNSALVTYNLEWVKFLYKSINQNILAISGVLFIFLIITIIGIIYFKKFIKEDNVFILFPAGMVTGSTIFVLLLGILSHVFKGRWGIFIIFAIYISIALWFLVKEKKRFKAKLFKNKITTKIVLGMQIMLAAILVIKAGNSIFGGDAITYWGLSTSFANGNYPQVLPWQPQFLTVHHQGAFLLLGAINAITGVDIRQIHFLFAAFIIFGGFWLLWGLIYRETKNILYSLLPPLFAFIVIGAFLFPIPSSLLTTTVTRSVEGFPIFHDVKNALGGLTSFFDLFYVIPRTFALSTMMLVLLLTGKFFKGSILKRMLLICLTCISILSIDESMFALLIIPMLFWMIGEFFKTKNKTEFIKAGLISLVVFASLFFVVGNPMRDSMLTPNYEAPRFAIVGLKDIALQGRVGLLKSVEIMSESTTNVVWFIPNYLYLLIAAALLGFPAKSKKYWFTFFIAISALLFYFLVDHTFWPQNYVRFLLLSYQFLGMAMAMAIAIILSKKSMVHLIIIAFLLTLTPSIIGNIVVIAKSLPDKYYSNFNPITPKIEVLSWINKNLKYDNKVFFIDGFLNGKNYSDSTLHGIQGHGLFIPISSSEIKMHTAEYGYEAIDVINNIDPSSIEKLKIKYVFVRDDQLTRLNKKRILELGDSSMFTLVYWDNIGKLYKIEDKFIESGSKLEGNIGDLTNLITQGSDVYIDQIPDISYYVRAAIFLKLNKHANIYSIWGQGHYNYVETFIDIKLPENKNCNYDYLILGLETDPQKALYCKNVRVIWQSNQAVLYEVI